MRILVVEDEEEIARDVARHLSGAGYVVETVADGEEADFRGCTEDYDAAILDLGLPGRDGLSVLRSWRRAGRAFPVLALTARDSWQERVEGMDAGCDDYLGKPFRMEELLARLRAVLRRSHGLADAVIVCGALELDTRSARIMLDGHPLELTPLEFRLLNYLMHHAGRPVPRETLLEHVYADAERHMNALEVLVNRVRRKLGGRFLRTRRGHGYLLDCETSTTGGEERGGV